MDKETFVKLFDFKSQQVLITKEEDSTQKKEFILKQRTDIDSMSYIVSMGFNVEVERDISFERYSEKDAETFIGFVNKAFKK